MPSKFLCCLPLSCGAHTIGIFQWLGTAAGIVLLIDTLNNDNSQLMYPFEPVALILFAYTVPALVWLTMMFYDTKATRKFYSGVYVFFHVLVALYLLIMPLVVLRGNYAESGVSTYLIVNSSVHTVGILWYFYCFTCLQSYAHEIESAQSPTYAEM